MRVQYSNNKIFSMVLSTLAECGHTTGAQEIIVVHYFTQRYRSTGVLLSTFMAIILCYFVWCACHGLFVRFALRPNVTESIVEENSIGMKHHLREVHQSNLLRPKVCIK